MARMSFTLEVNNNSLYKRYEENLKFITEARSSAISYYTGKDSYGDYVLPVIRYNSFLSYEQIYHGFSTRLGGVSRDHLSSLNLSFSRGDEKDYVIANHTRLGNALGYDINSCVFSDQIHENTIRVVGKEDCGKGITIKSDIEGVDGLVTNERGVTLVTFYADCVPNFFFDPVKNVVGLAHSGWRGTVKNIGKCMIDTMAEQFGSDKCDIICAIGPSICMDCYEVSDEVAQQFMSIYDENQIKKILKNKGNGKYLLDLHKACQYNLQGAGVPALNISMPDLCTCCNKDFLFSHRASHGMRGNLAAVIGLK